MDKCTQLTFSEIKAHEGMNKHLLLWSVHIKLSFYICLSEMPKVFNMSTRIEGLNIKYKTSASLLMMTCTEML